MELVKVQVIEYIIGKEVIDDSGNIMGIVKDIEWDFENNRVDSLVVEEKRGGFSLGSKPRQTVPYEHIYSIGDKILISIKFVAEQEEEEDTLGLNKLKLNF